MSIDKLFKEAKAEPKTATGALAPLFDRLSDEEPEIEEEYPAKRFYTKNEIIDSIQREITRILSTRATVRRELYQALASNPLNYGLPEMFGLADFSHFDATNQGEWDQVKHLCEKAISHYEPRLKEARIEIKSYDRQQQSLLIMVHAILALSEFQEEVSFPASFSLTSAGHMAIKDAS